MERKGSLLHGATVEAHIGDIWVESALDQGSTFYVSLPVQDMSNE